MRRHALAISTYVPAGAAPGVRRRLPVLLESLEASGYPGTVVIVDDGSTDTEHRAELRQLERRYHVEWRTSNGGISRTKNTCLRMLMEQRVDVGFLADDDLIFRPGWHEPYLEAQRATGIAHFSWASDTFLRTMRKWPEVVNGHPIVRTSRLNGALLTFTAEVIARIGGFRVLPRAWGHEHLNWTDRIVRAGLAPYYCDVIDSNRWLNLGPHSAASSVTAMQKKEWSQENRAAAADLSQLWWPIAE